MAATITDITTRTAAFGRVIDAMMTHSPEQSVEFTALGMTLRTRFNLAGELGDAGWEITRLGENEARVASVTIKANLAGRYPFAKRFVVMTGTEVLADADALRTALADALELVHGA